MKLPRLKPLIFPGSLLIVGGLLALAAEATTLSSETQSLYGMIKAVSDITLLVGGGWFMVALARVLLPRPEGPRA